MLQRIVSRFAKEKKFLAQQAKLLANQNSFQIEIAQFSKTDRIVVSNNGTLADIARQLKTQFSMSQVTFYCNQNIQLPDSTDLAPLINRYFYVGSPEYYPILIEGELFDLGKNQQVIEGTNTLELPVVYKKEANYYFQRVDRWYQSKVGDNIMDGESKITAKQAADIFVQALIDPLPQQRNILAVQKQWNDIYVKVRNLKEQKRAADLLCVKRAKRRMSLGLLALVCNVGFIWSGTYIFYSWDIIEPLAYFVSSLGGIVLATQFFKLRRPYSNILYQQYLTEKLASKVYKQIGFDQDELILLENQLNQLQSILKDHYLKRL